MVWLQPVLLRRGVVWTGASPRDAAWKCRRRVIGQHRGQLTGAGAATCALMQKFLSHRQRCYCRYQ